MPVRDVTRVRAIGRRQPAQADDQRDRSDRPAHTIARDEAMQERKHQVELKLDRDRPKHPGVRAEVDRTVVVGLKEQGLSECRSRVLPRQRGNPSEQHHQVHRVDAQETILEIRPVGDLFAERSDREHEATQHHEQRDRGVTLLDQRDQRVLGVDPEAQRIPASGPWPKREQMQGVVKDDQQALAKPRR